MTLSYVEHNPPHTHLLGLINEFSQAALWKSNIQKLVGFLYTSNEQSENKIKKNSIYNIKNDKIFKNKWLQPWLVWLSGLSAGLRIKGSLVQFPVRAHAWVAGQVPSRGCTRVNHTLMFLSLYFSLPSPLSKKEIKSF